MKLIFVGKSGTGKSLIASDLSMKGFKVATSYTTRPKRDSFDTTHIFVTPDEAASIENKIAHTTFNNYEYFMTKEMIADSDVIIVEPSGVTDVVTSMPSEAFRLIYFSADTEESRKQAVLSRNTDIETAEKEYNDRLNLENELFDAFAKQVRDFSNSDLKNLINLTCVSEYTNTYDPIWNNILVDRLIEDFNLHRNVAFITKQAVEDGNLMQCNKENNEPMDKPDINVMADTIIADDAIFNKMMKNFLSKELLNFETDSKSRQN